MKRMIALLIAVAFVATVASLAFGRTIDEERDAVRAYLKVIDAKIIKYRKAGNTAKMKILQADKAGTLRRWEKLKAQMEAQAPAPRVAPVPPPPPRPVVAPAPAPTGLFGMGLNTSVSLGYIAGKSTMVGRADLILGDPLAMGTMLGLSEKAISYRIGLGGASGNDINDNTIKAIPLFVDGILNLPADMMGGLETYVGGGLNYTLYGTDRKVGTYGAEIFVGMQGDIGLGSKSMLEVGYEAVRCGDTNKRSAKGLSIMVGQQIML
jgi:hypothetical protein